MKRSFGSSLMASVTFLLVAMLLELGCSGGSKSTQPTPDQLTLVSLSAISSAPGSIIAGKLSGIGDSMDTIAVYVGDLGVPAVLDGSGGFHFCIPLLSPGIRLIHVQTIEGNRSNSISFDVLALPSTGLPSGKVAQDIISSIDNLSSEMKQTVSWLGIHSNIGADSLNMLENITAAERLMKNLRLELATWPDSSRSLLDAYLTQAGISELFEIAGRSPGLRNKMQQPIAHLSTAGDYDEFYTFVALDNLSMLVSANKAALTTASIAATVSGAAILAVPLGAITLSLSMLDGAIDGWIPTDIYRLKIRFVPQNGSAIRVGEKAQVAFDGYFRSQSSPEKVTAGLVLQSVFFLPTAVGVSLPTVESLVNKILQMAAIDHLKEVIPPQPVYLDHAIKVDMGYYSLSAFQAFARTDYYPGAFLEKVLLLVGVQSINDGYTSFRLQSSLATYDSQSNTISALREGTVPGSSVSARVWAIKSLCEGKWWSFACLGVEWLAPFQVGDADIAPLTILPAEFPPPSAITDLSHAAAASDRVTLTWTAPGNHGYTGTAIQYDIRYSLSSITEASWSSATQVSGEPTPKSAGSSETFTVTGLSPNTTYYFALRTADESLNWSGLSNVASAITPSAADTTPPAAVTNLAAGNPTSGSITLTWTAPGDDGNTGTASQYDIRYSLFSITEAIWSSATQVPGEPTPKPAGSSETFTVAGLSPNTTYYFALKTADEGGNWSSRSNSASGTTQPGSGDSAPLVYFKFDGNMSDASDNELDATGQNISFTTDRFGQSNGACLFNGTNSQVSSEVYEEFFIRHFTLSAWIKVGGIGVRNPRIVAVGPVGGTNQYYGLYIDQPSRKLAYLQRNATSYDYVLANYVTSSSTQWVHVVAVVDSLSLRIYVNGTLDKSGTLTKNIPAFTTALLQIGYSDSKNDYFQGAIDDVRAFDRALTDTEVSQLYHERGW